MNPFDVLSVTVLSKNANYFRKPRAIIGGFLIGIVQNIAGGYLDPLVGGGLKEVVPFIIVLLILMIKPHGLFGSKGIERV